LTFLYVASTAALLALSTGFLYWTLKRNLQATRLGMLASKVQVMRVLVRQHSDSDGVLMNEVEHEASTSQPFRYYIRLLNAEGQSLVETPGMNVRLPSSRFPVPRELADDSPGWIAREVRPAGDYLLFSAQVPPGSAKGRSRVLQVGLDASAGNALLTDYRQKLLVILGLGTVLAAFAGVWVARKGMRPLAEITRTAQHITASHLHGRIAGTPWPAELANLAAAFDAMLDRLEDSFNRLSQFSADLAHALRTPIHNLRGEAEVLLARSRTPEEYQHTLASSLEECDRLSRMIDGLLFLARADDPKAARSHVRFDARKQLDAVREFYDALASEQGVTVSCEGAAWLTGDPMLFRRAVSNLLGNALRFTPARGCVRLSANTQRDQSVEIQVHDSGSGIAPEHLFKIFDRFYRVGESHSPVPGGIGLGLAIVRSIMRLHGGTASVESTVGKGSTFTLRFPAELESSLPVR
jgi:two-component system heavy metal sensor histidine kinase CusS